MTADLQDLFDQAGRNPPTRALDADAVLHRARARRSRNRRTIGAVAATVAVTLALVVGLASQRRLSADPDPVAPLPTVQAARELGPSRVWARRRHLRGRRGRQEPGPDRGRRSRPSGRLRRLLGRGTHLVPRRAVPRLPGRRRDCW